MLTHITALCDGSDQKCISDHTTVEGITHLKTTSGSPTVSQEQGWFSYWWVGVHHQLSRSNESNPMNPVPVNPMIPSNERISFLAANEDIVTCSWSPVQGF